MTDKPTLTLRLTNELHLEFDVTSRTLTLIAHNGPVRVMTSAMLNDQDRLALADVLTQGVDPTDVRDDTPATLSSLGLPYEAFMVRQVDLPLGTSSVARKRTTIHQRECTDTPSNATPALADVVQRLVYRYAGDVSHEIEFCDLCFPQGETPDGDVFGYPVTDSALLNDYLRRIQQRFTARVRTGWRPADFSPESDSGALTPAEQAALAKQLDDSVTLDA